MSAPRGALRLAPVFLEKIWAPRKLPSPWQEWLSPPPHTGEVWLASDRHQVTKVAGGELDGLGLDELVRRWPEHILGPDHDGGFPLLLKLLNVGQWLSVQVHPDDTVAARLEGEPWGKSEAWHILAAKPGAELVHGLNPGVGRAEVERALNKGRLPDLLARVPARTGDTFAVPAGTLHSAGPGLFFLEVQQASDVTYRFYDWERPGADGQPRPLHVANALDALAPSGPGRPEPAGGAKHSSRLLVQMKPFSLLKYQLSGSAGLPSHPGGPRLLLVAAGRGRLSFPGGGRPAAELEQGSCWLLPAGLPSAHLNPEPELTLYLARAAAA